MSASMTKPSSPLTIAGGLGWDRVLRAFFQPDGDCAALGAEAAICLLALQSAVIVKTGVVRMSVSELALRTGIAVRSVSRALSVLRAAKYIDQLPVGPGRTSSYRIIRWLIATTSAGDQVPISVPYVPDEEHARWEGVKAAIRSGDLAALPVGVTVHIHIDQLQIVQPGGVGVQVHTGAPSADQVDQWWRQFRPADWDAVLAAAGIKGGRITPEAKAAAWIAAHGGGQ
jgi:DNA-binding transcriptional ArsR family regulator